MLRWACFLDCLMQLLSQVVSVQVSVYVWVCTNTSTATAGWVKGLCDELRKPLTQLPQHFENRLYPCANTVQSTLSGDLLCLAIQDRNCLICDPQKYGREQPKISVFGFAFPFIFEQTHASFFFSKKKRQVCKQAKRFCLIFLIGTAALFLFSITIEVSS